MKQHLNNKGVTLIELIVSFALVAVAIIYFYQTLYTVKKLYGESQKDTNNFVDVNYAYRIIDELHNKCVEEKCVDLCSSIEDYEEKDANFLAEVTTSCENNENQLFSKINFNINNKPYSMYFYNENTD